MSGLRNVYFGRNVAYPLRRSEGVVVVVSQEANVRSSVLMFLSTPKGTRVNLPGYGLTPVLFENMSPGLVDVLREDAKVGLRTYEPRIRVTDVTHHEVQSSNGLYGVRLQVHFVYRATESRDVVSREYS